MEYLIQWIIITPLLGYFTSLFVRESNERMMSRLAISTVFAQFGLVLSLLIMWILSGFRQTNITEITLYQNESYHFFIDLFLDKTSMIFLFVGSFLSMLVTVFSQYYLHKESGYKRFFNTILLFYFGYNLTVLSGNFETLFMGWEVLGLSSFLLIAFYRYRYLPVKNAVKVFTIYRIGDVGLLLGMWLSHHFWQENVTFLKMSDVFQVSEHIHTHSILGATIALCILITAWAKSAQMPFSFWLPRAMEGPTPSSAIFYGSLSVHMGVFLLLRTYPLIENQYSVKGLIILMGLFTAFVATGISRVQSSIKSQVAYTSIAQIGLIFIEIALGWHVIALIHFMGNAFLRTYQLLISPSTVTYKIREQFYHFQPRQKSLEDFFPKKMEHALYILCLKEWDLDNFMYTYFWLPVKWIGKKMDFITINKVYIFIVPILVTGIASYFLHIHFPNKITQYLPEFFGALALLLAIKAFSERYHVRMSLLLIVLNHFFIALAVSFNEHLNLTELLIYLSGVVIAGSIGFFAINRIKKLGEKINLLRFHGHSFEHPKIAMVFLIACLGLTGFPISPTFLGEDIMFSHIHEDQFILATLVSFSFVVDGLALIRLFAKVFMGPHSKTYHEIAYRSS